MPSVEKIFKNVAYESGEAIVAGSRFAKNLFNYGSAIIEQQTAELKQEQSMNNEEWAKELKRIQAKYKTISNIVENIEDIKDDIPKEVKDMLEAELKKAIANVKPEEPKPEEEQKPEESSSNS